MGRSLLMAAAALALSAPMMNSSAGLLDVPMPPPSRKVAHRYQGPKHKVRKSGHGRSIAYNNRIVKRRAKNKMASASRKRNRRK